jgi:hypothetical protein
MSYIPRLKEKYQKEITPALDEGVLIQQSNGGAQVVEDISQPGRG